VDSDLTELGIDLPRAGALGEEAVTPRGIDQKAAGVGAPAALVLDPDSIPSSPIVTSLARHSSMIASYSGGCCKAEGVIGEPGKLIRDPPPRGLPGSLASGRLPPT
jgi:hypothetical protein